MRPCFRGAQAAILMYDITAASSFEGLQRWLDEIHAELPTGGCLLFIVGSKLDCGAQREVTAEQAKAQAITGC